jgi:DNA ligase (NAD+)
MREWGLPIEPHWRRCEGIDAVAAFCQEWADKRLTLEFDTDGVVVKVDDLAVRERLGATAKFPRWATAFKFPAQQATTVLKSIAVNVGRTGAVTPFAVLEPVRLAGSTISMATLHNAEDVARKDLRDGDRVLIEKGGDVIPKVVKAILPHAPESVPWQMPSSCPECGSTLRRDEDEVVWRCLNESCPAKLQRGLEHFASRSAMNIEGLGESLVEQLIEQGLVKTFADIYKLTVSRLENLVVAPREPRSGACAPPQARKGRYEHRRANRAQQGERPVAPDLRARHSPRRRKGGGDPRAPFPDDGAYRGGAGGGTAVGLRNRPGRRGVGPRLCRRTAKPGPHRPARQGRRQHDEPGAGTSHEPGPLAGKVFVLTGTLAAMSREEATEALERLARAWPGR